MASTLKVDLIYFSPTKTTERIVRAIGEGMGGELRHINLTLPHARLQVERLTGDIVVIGVPVYGERIPHLVWQYLKKLEGMGKPLIGVAVYGNAGYGITLRQFELLAEKNRFQLVGAGAFVAEHTFASEHLDVAFGRPHEQDLREARTFGEQMASRYRDGKLGTVKIPPTKLPLFLSELAISSVRLPIKEPKVQLEKCNHCQICTKVCPVGAIDAKTLEIEGSKCLRCYACVKRCPKAARVRAFRVGPMEKVFVKLGKPPKSNQIF